jgi:hypothetical protein
MDEFGDGGQHRFPFPQRKGQSETESKAELRQVNMVFAPFQSDSAFHVGGVAIDKY